MSPFKISYEKACHLPVEMEHKAYWVVQKCNLNLLKVGTHHQLQMSKIEELCNDAYENSRIYKEWVKAFHDRHISRKSFHPGQKVLLFDAKFKLFLGKLRSKWI
jgi:hypothetical protein